MNAGHGGHGGHAGHGGAGTGDGRTAAALATVGTAVIVMVALARAVISFAPKLDFDVDPAHFVGSLDALGPAGSLWLDVVLVLGCGAVLVGEVIAGRRIHWLMFAAALAPAPLVLWHGADDLGDLWRGTTWLSGALALVAVAHAARRPGVRRFIIAALIASLSPLAARGAMQVTIEHAHTLASFESNRESFFADRGWAPDSSAARIYERRLRQPQPTGWFATSNVFASIMLFACVAWAGLGCAAWRARLSSGWSGSAALAAAVAGVMLVLTGSRGAVVAGLAGLGLLAPALLPDGRWPRIARLAPWVAVLMVVGALGGVVARGLVLPEGFAGEKSLLFRWHYLEAASEIIGEAPLLGVGPDGFQEAYSRHRPPRNPEEVAFAHSIYIDWLAALGVVAITWIGLTMRQLWQGAARSPNEGAEQVEPGGPPWRGAALGFACVALIGLVPALTLPGLAGALDPAALLARLLGVMGFLALGLAAWRILPAVGGRGSWAVAAAAIALVVHAQIEMTFAQSGAVVWCMVALGSVAPAPAGRRGARLLRSSVVGCFVLGLAAWMAFAGAFPAMAQERAVRSAAHVLRPFAEARQWMVVALAEPSGAPRQVATTTVLAALRRAGVSDEQLAGSQLSPARLSAGHLEPGDAARVESALRAVEPRHRERVADLLVDAYWHLPTTAHPLEAAALQLERAAPFVEPEARIAELEKAARLLDLAYERHRQPSSLSLAALVYGALAVETGAARHQDRAIAMALRLSEMDPNGIGAWVRLGDLRWMAGDRNRAAIAYRRALRADANFVLDPLKQLPDGERRRIQARIAQAEEEFP